MTVKLLTEHHLKFLSLTGGYTGSSVSTLVKMPHCWKSHVVAQLCVIYFHVTVNGTLAEGLSQSNNERKKTAEKWMEVTSDKYDHFATCQ